MDERVFGAWQEYREAIREAYVREDAWILNMDDAAGLERLADLSESLGNRLDEATAAEQEKRPLGGEPEAGEGRLGRDADRERNETDEAAFAAATVDLTIAATIMRGSRDEWGQELAVPADADLLPMEFLLSKADQAFGGPATAVAGGQYLPETPMSMARSTANDLVSRSREPVQGFTVSLFSLNMAGWIDHAGLLETFDRMIEKAVGRLRPGSRLLRSAIQKLVRTMGTEDRLEEALDVMTERILGIRRFRVAAFEERMIARLVGKGRCIVKANGRLKGRPPLRLINREMLRSEFDELRFRFSDRMWWARMARRAMQAAALVVMTIFPGPGHLVMTGAYGVGLAICLFALADRFDTLPGRIGWVRGIPTIIGEV